MKSKDDELVRVRNRATYQFFQELYEFLHKEPGIVDIMRKFYDVLDAKKAYGSERHAMYAEESLELVLRDNGLSTDKGDLFSRKT